MNIKTANRLCELRKKYGYSQEELASKLGVSRQAVSKWERSESSPDTDNLIELAKIYGISLDELLNGDDAIDIIEENKQTLELEDETEQNSEEKQVTFCLQSPVISCIQSAWILLMVLSYIVLGIVLPYGKGWSCCWFLFILIPAGTTFIDAIVQKSLNHFAYPCLVAAVYCALGMFLNLWHPLWVIFFTIPIYYIIASAVDQHHQKNKGCE